MSTSRAPASWRSCGGARALACVLLLPAALPACYAMSSFTAGSALPADADIAAIEPGRTTRAQLVQRLGPPDEYLQPSLVSALTHDDSQERRVLQEHEVFDRRSASWTRERQDDRLWFFFPVFSHERLDIRTDRLVVLFDEAGVVSAVGLQRGIDTP